MREGLRRGALVMAGYRQHVTLTAEELDRLAALIRARWLVLVAWQVCSGQATPAKALADAAETKALADVIASRIRAAPA
jgi:Ser/Thr protein kinase RdoA (MazF antagonist)